MVGLAHASQIDRTEAAYLDTAQTHGHPQLELEVELLVSPDISLHLRKRWWPPVEYIRLAANKPLFEDCETVKVRNLV